MSILIRSNVHLPRSCRKCPFNGGDWCIASEKVRIGKHGNVNEHRHPDCPLVEIPTPHGRLIDAEELSKVFDWKQLENSPDEKEQTLYLLGQTTIEAIREAPTIIEVEANK